MNQYTSDALYQAHKSPKIVDFVRGKNAASERVLLCDDEEQFVIKGGAAQWSYISKYIIYLHVILYNVEP